MKITQVLKAVTTAGALALMMSSAALAVTLNLGNGSEPGSLDPYLPIWLRKLQAVLVHVLCAAVLFGLAYVMWGSAGQFLQNGETTAQLKILKAPFIYGMSVLCAATAIIHLFLVAQPPQERAEGEGVAL